uniref:Uncharacterized protein n=1 Tax=Timema poppense TaxID=170557 RepID=A0A7R9GSJ2_TIMPO|nr:unnamed protein product [Timema poppensis]
MTDSTATVHAMAALGPSRAEPRTSQYIGSYLRKSEVTMCTQDSRGSKDEMGYVQRNASMEANVSRKISVNVQKDITGYVASFGSGVTTVRLVAGYLSEVLAQNPVSMVPAKLISVYVTSVGLEGCAIKKFHKQGIKRKIPTKKKICTEKPMQNIVCCHLLCGLKCFTKTSSQKLLFRIDANYVCRKNSIAPRFTD